LLLHRSVHSDFKQRFIRLLREIQRCLRSQSIGGVF
jgi:hypothetical protein